MRGIMSDQDQDKNALKAEQERARHEREAFDYTLKGKADDVGIVAKGSAANAGDNVGADSKKKRDKKFFDELLKAVLNTPEDVDNLLGEMGKAAKGAQEDFNKAKAYKSAYENGDFSQMLILLKQDDEETSGLSQKDILDKVRDKYADHASDYNNKRDFVSKSKQEILDSDVSSEEQKNEAIELDNVSDMGELEATLGEFKNSHQATLDGTSDFRDKHSELRLNEIERSQNLSLSNTEISNDDFGDAFVEVSSGDREAKSYASTQEDPFAETAESISDPFNVAASAVGIETEMKNGLVNETVITPKVDTPTL